MKVSLGLSVLMMNVTFLTATSLRPSRASFRALEIQLIRLPRAVFEAKTA